METPVTNLIGLPNIGNTCYINCVLQFFLNSDLFIKHLNDTHVNPDTFLSYLKHLKEGTSVNYYLSKILNFLDKSTELYINQPNDAHEILVVILDIIEKENIDIYSLFKGVKITKIKCDNCNYKNILHECFNHLPFYLTKHSTLIELLKSEFDVEKLDYSCELCNKTTLVKYNSICKFPNIFILMNSNKTFVMDFPTKIKVKEDERSLINYQLSGCVNHYGSWLLGGHYTFSNELCEFDDMKINKNKLTSQFVYFLFYEY